MTAKRVVLTFVSGDFETGFDVLLRLKSAETLNRSDIQMIGQLPAAPELRQTLEHWRSSYAQLAQLQSRIVFQDPQVTNISYQNLGVELEQQFNEWLNSDLRDWQNIRDRIQRHLDPTEAIEVIIETSDLQIRQLPWHTWELFAEHYSNSEIALSASMYQMRSQPRLRTHQVKILAVLGNSKNINLEADRETLKKLSNAEITFLVEPTRQQLNDALWSKSWDILFFAGHSASRASGSDGYLGINQTDQLSIEELKYALKRAIEKGLQLALFNSCDGLGLAQQLSTLQLPHLIVMRESIPDPVAQEFLKYFLNAFSAGQSLYLAVREARERLQGLEDQFPYASWLPVICENPAARSLTWPQLTEVPSIRKSSRFPVLLAASLLAAFSLIGMRQQQWLQPLELKAFDMLLRLRPNEGIDPRLLIVAITEADIQSLKQYPISDRTLATALTQLERHQPRVIGTALFRDIAVGEGRELLAPHFKRKQFVGTCNLSDQDSKGVPAPPGTDLDHQGFGGVTFDEDRVLRRQLMYAQPDSDSLCQATTAFGLQVAIAYLGQMGIEPQPTAQDHLQLNRTVFSPLTAFSSGYQNIDARGYQVMLNYRSTPDQPIKGIARKITLTQAISGKFDPTWVRDRIVLIGVDAPASVHNDFLTPYSSANQSTSGLYLQAHMVSQVLSAVLDRRPLITVAAGWQDAVWILGWAIAGSGIGRRTQQQWQIYLIDAALLLGLLGLSFSALTWMGLWLPLIPAMLAFLASQSIVVIYTNGKFGARVRMNNPETER
jgi:CHASE2 domain-containing sensor protein